MGREIKFRSWNVQAKTMDYEVTIDPNGKVAAYSPLDGHYVRGFSDSEMIPLQYTGLEDKNGREIFEGDILKDDAGIGEVEWVQEHCSYMVFTRNPSIYNRLDSDGHLNLSEVIGNIYENPELLEV